MSSSLQNEDFDVLQGLLHLRNSIFHILTKPPLDNSLAAILVNRAVIAENPPSVLLIPRGSKSQNKCQKEGHKKSLQAPKGRPRTIWHGMDESARAGGGGAGEGGSGRPQTRWASRSC